MMLGNGPRPLEFRTHMPTRYRVVLAAIGVPAVLIVLAAGPSPWLASLVADSWQP